MSRPLTGELVGLRGARVGNYRVLFRVEDGPSVVRVYRVAHRADAYRSLD